MASTPKEKAYARKYYRTNPAYRRKKIEDRKKEYQENKDEEASYSRKYYHSNSTYRRRRILQVASYNKSHRTRKRK